LAAVFDAVWSQLGSTSLVSAILPIAIGGGLAHFKPWLPTENDIRERTDLRKQVLMEGVNKHCHRLFLEAESRTASELRGAPPNLPDFVADHTSELFRTFSVLGELSSIRTRIRRHYSYLFLTAATGVVCFLVSLLSQDARPYVALACYVAVITQLYSVSSLRRWMKRLEDYERTT